VAAVPDSADVALVTYHLAGNRHFYTDSVTDQ
jgi:hypothetical protein